MFDERFEVYLADTRESRQLHYKLRYRIYCEERGYEPRQCFPSGHERDGADEQAVHFLVRDRNSGGWIATMRLVLPGPTPFPIRANCTLGGHGSAAIPWNRCAEISRLGIIRNRPSGGGIVPLGESGATSIPARWVPEITFGLLRAAYNYCLQRGLDHCLWMSTSGLVRMFNRYHLPMRPIGEPCEFRGMRQPFIIDVETCWQALARVTEAEDPGFARGQGYRRWSEAPVPGVARPARIAPAGNVATFALPQPALA